MDKLREIKRFYADEMNEMVSYGASDSDIVDFIDRLLKSAKAQSEWVSVRLDNSKRWVDQNVHDGEDRAGAKNDIAAFSPDDLQELFDDFVEYVKGPSE